MAEYSLGQLGLTGIYSEGRIYRRSQSSFASASTAQRFSVTFWESGTSSTYYCSSAHTSAFASSKVTRCTAGTMRQTWCNGNNTSINTASIGALLSCLEHSHGYIMEGSRLELVIEPMFIHVTWHSIYLSSIWKLCHADAWSNTDLSVRGKSVVVNNRLQTHWWWDENITKQQGRTGTSTLVTEGPKADDDEKTQNG